MSCIVLDIDLTFKNVIKDLGFLLTAMFRASPFVLQKKYKHTKQAFWCTRILHGLVWKSRSLDYNELQNVLPEDLMAEYFGKQTEKC